MDHVEIFLSLAKIMHVIWNECSYTIRTNKRFSDQQMRTNSSIIIRYIYKTYCWFTDIFLSCRFYELLPQIDNFDCRLAAESIIAKLSSKYQFSSPNWRGVDFLQNEWSMSTSVSFLMWRRIYVFNVCWEWEYTCLCETGKTCICLCECENVHVWVR